MDWQDALEAEIPFDRLLDSFNAALKAHSGSFPINAFEVLDAWRQISQAEHDAWKERYALDRINREKSMPFVPPPEGLMEQMQAVLRRSSMKAVK